jgi:two-component sensor histidine kinase
LYAYLFEKTREKTQESLTTQNDVLHNTLLNLHAAQERLQAHRHDLELIVKERTGDLKKTNERLHLEIVERKEAEEKIAASLKEKEVLLKEIHHRVKNNLQMIDSLLNLQSTKINHKRSINLLKESQNRVRSMALIHEKLYQSDSLSEILFDEYILDLTHFLFQSYGADSDKLELKADLESISIDIDTAVPLGLIINELISNSLKHAFPKNNRGEINFALHMVNADKINLTVSDNGVGIPKGLLLENRKSLGLELIRLLVDQLDGDIDINGSRGTTISILIPTFK